MSQLYGQLRGPAHPAQAIGELLAEDVAWHAADPINTLTGPAAVVNQFLLPLLQAMPDLERRPLIEITGPADQGVWLDGTGYFVGTFTAPLFGIPATGKPLYLRYTEMVLIAQQRIQQCFIIPDFIDVMVQAGVYPLRPALGHAGLVPAPTGQDGLQGPAANASEADQSRHLVLAMLDCLGRYDGQNLLSMDLENYWHRDFMWYGPGGIGTTRGIDGFRAQHQGPFVGAFPDRSIDHKINMLAQGNFAATGGWPHMSASHAGDGWLGLPASGASVSMRVMDIWRREGQLLRENWVAIDMVHLLRQLGVDVFAKMHSQIKNRQH